MIEHFGRRLHAFVGRHGPPSAAETISTSTLAHLTHSRHQTGASVRSRPRKERPRAGRLDGPHQRAGYAFASTARSRALWRMAAHDSTRVANAEWFASAGIKIVNRGAEKFVKFRSPPLMASSVSHSALY